MVVRAKDLSSKDVLQAGYAVIIADRISRSVLQPINCVPRRYMSQSKIPGAGGDSLWLEIHIAIVRFAGWTTRSGGPKLTKAGRPAIDIREARCTAMYPLVPRRLFDEKRVLGPQLPQLILRRTNLEVSPPIQGETVRYFILGCAASLDTAAGAYYLLR
jgi:hypothetical protein